MRTTATRPPQLRTVRYVHTYLRGGAGAPGAAGGHRTASPARQGRTAPDPETAIGEGHMRYGTGCTSRMRHPRRPPTALPPTLRRPSPRPISPKPLGLPHHPTRPQGPKHQPDAAHTPYATLETTTSATPFATPGRAPQSNQPVLTTAPRHATSPPRTPRAAQAFAHVPYASRRLQRVRRAQTCANPESPPPLRASPGQPELRYQLTVTRRPVGSPRSRTPQHKLRADSPYFAHPAACTKSGQCGSGSR